jgi:predicted GNAT family acetyltransferase
VTRSTRFFEKVYHDLKGEPSAASMKFGRPKPSPQLVTNGRFELERDGHVAYLEYNLTDKLLQLIHTEVPEALRGKGVASTLAESAFQWAREHGVKVDVICPYVAAYLKRHPEYSDLVIK